MKMQGRYFEEIVIGEEIESATRTITEADIRTFAELSGDTNPLHLDPEFARTTVFGEPIAHGLLGLSVASGLAWQTGLVQGTADAFIGLEWKFRAPIRIGDTVRLRMVATQKREMPHLHGGFVTISAVLLNQRDEVVQKGTWTILVRSRPSESAADSAP